jgi:chromosome segregation ATPase
MDTKKVLGLGLLFFLITSPALAQGGLGGDVGDVGGLAQGLANGVIDVMNYYTNVNLEDQPALTFFATMGILYLAVFVALEKTLEAAGMKDMFVTGQGRGEDKSNKRLIALALLFFAVFVGSGAFTPVIVIMSQSIVATFVIGVAAVLAYTVIAGGGVLKGGYFGARGTKRAAESKGRNKYASETEELADAIEKTEEAEEILQNTKKEEQDAENRAEGGDSNDADQEARDAEQKIKRALDDLEAVESDINDILDKRGSEVRSLVSEAKSAIQEQNNEIGELRDFKQRISDLNQGYDGLETRVNSASNWNEIDQSYQGMKPKLHKQVKQLQQDLERMNDEESKEEAEFRDQMDLLLECLESFEKVSNVLNELPQIMKEAESEEEFLSNISSEIGDKELNEAVGRDESEIKDIGKNLENLQNHLNNIESSMEEAEEFIEKEMTLDDQELNQLNRIYSQVIPITIEKIEDIEKELQQNKNWFQPSNNQDQQNFIDSLNQQKDRIRTIEGEMKELERKNEEDEKILNNMTQKLRNFLS